MFVCLISRLVFLGDPNLEVTDRGQVLKIKSARLGDKAHYQCTVMNTAGKQSKDFNLSVYGEDPILKRILSYEKQENIPFECYCSNVPPSSSTVHQGRQRDHGDHGPAGHGGNSGVREARSAAPHHHLVPRRGAHPVQPAHPVRGAGTLPEDPQGAGLRRRPLHLQGDECGGQR